MHPLNDVPFSANKCTGCSGMWFREDSHHKAKKIKGIEDIDQPDTNAAAVYDEVTDVNCPTCNQQLIEMVDSTQLHVEFEACPDGCGVFFDAGEFADFAEFTFIERIKQTYDTIKSNLK